MAAPMSAEDKLAVIDLIADYAFRVDSGDVEGYINNFAPDGVFDTSNGPLEGRDAIRAYVAHLVEIGQVGGGPGTRRHFMGIPAIHGDSERCTAKTYILWPASNADGVGAQVVRVGAYTDDIVKVNGAWKFARRHIETDLANPPAR
jgi:hypothetical protein